MIDKILVAVDHSEKNQFVFDSAVSLAKATGATLMLLHILPEDEAGNPVLPIYTIPFSRIFEERGDREQYQQELAQYQQWGLDFLHTLTQKAVKAGVKAEYSQLSGNPGWMICELADRWSADLILVGSRGLKGLKEMFLGSVSNYVTHHAPCSVLIVRTAIDNDSEPVSSETKNKADSQQQLNLDR